MKVVISVIRPFHFVLLANTLIRNHHTVTIWSGAPRKFFNGLSDEARTRLIPAPLAILGRLFHTKFSSASILREAVFWDKSVAAVFGSPDVFVGLATLALHSGTRAKHRGARFVLDRACPHVDFQQKFLREESEKIGAVFNPLPEWFRDRQIQEYEEADAILVPSNFTASSFPPALKSKLVRAPLIGRCDVTGSIHEKRNEAFTVGIVGGEPRRKGYLYLLRAWKKLALPNAKLLIRSSADFSQYPALHQLLKELPNVEIVRYVPNMNDFYQRCDAFVLSSVDDGFGMALFEAMANGVPCIVTRNCGASELLSDGEDGIVIDARSDDQIAEALLRLYGNEEERLSIARKGRLSAIRITTGDGANLYEQAVRNVLTIPALETSRVPVSSPGV